jgi:hypothetical protein
MAPATKKEPLLHERNLEDEEERSDYCLAYLSRTNYCATRWRRYLGRLRLLGCNLMTLFAASVSINTFA